MPNLIGQRVGHGKYRITARLGSGGMATVYRAEHQLLNFDVAIKVVKRDLTEEDDPLPRLRREVSSVLALTHPHILPIYEFDRFADGDGCQVYYIVMKLVEGKSLKERLQALAMANQRMPLDEVVRVLQAVAEALDYAHSGGVMHRDVKPGNILLADDDGIYLTDFGLAKFFGVPSGLTKNGTAVGTPDYISPEQAQGEMVDYRADLYALAIVAYEMLAGRLPFRAETPTAVMLSHIQESPPPPRIFNPSIPEAAEQALLKALAKSPDDRYQSATDLCNALQGAPVVEEVEIQNSSDEFTAQYPVPPSHSPLRVLLVGHEQQPSVQEPKREHAPPSTVTDIGIVILFAIGIILGLLALRPPRPPPPPNTITFLNAIWPMGPVVADGQAVGSTDFSLDRHEYQMQITGVAKPIDAPAHSDVLFEQGLCVAVDAYVKNGRPAAYGVIFHYLNRDDLLYLSIDEQAETARLEQGKGSSSEVVAESKGIGDALRSIGPDGWHSILMAIRPDRADIWLNRHSILEFDGKHLSEGTVGVFAVSGDIEDTLPLEISFRNFEAIPLSVECLP